VAELRAVFPVAMTMSYLLSTFVHLFTPLAVRLHTRGDHAELTHLYWRTAAWSTIVAYPLFLAATGLAEPVTELLFGERYEDAAILLAILAGGLFVTAATGPNDHLLAAIGEVRYLAVTNLLAIGVGLALNFVLISRYDAVGAALAASVTFALVNLARQVGLRTRTQVGFLDRETAPLYVLVVVVTACYYAVLAALTPPLGVSVGLTALAVAAVLLAARRNLALTDTFPELARLPGARLLRGRSGRGSAD
jgi:O-antigen/teichoic acid export membrane protein